MMSGQQFVANRSGQQDQTAILDTRLIDYLSRLEDPRREKILDFHRQHEPQIATSKGSQVKHQAWPGGYQDHLAECFRIAESTFQALTASMRAVPFTLPSALIVLYFHDVEKIWKYTTGLPANFDKDQFYDVTLPQQYGIVFSPEERNALHYIHGESEAEYSPTERKAGPLAAFCHTADHLSARMWHAEGKGLG